MSEQKWLTVEESADQLRITPAWLSRLAAAGEIQADKPGKRWLFRQEYLDAYVAKNRRPATEPVERRRRRRVA